MGNVKIKAPVTVLYNGQYVAPGTEIEVSEAEAKRLAEVHGEYGAAGEPDPGNTNMRNVDIASIKALNEQKSIHKGIGDLNDMTKAELLEVAEAESVKHEASDTKQQLVDKIKAGRKGKA